MVKTLSFKRLILRAVLRQVSPMVIRLVSVADQMPLHEFHDVFRTILGWNGDLGYILRVHGEEINSFRRKTRSKALHEFKLHRQEKFLYVCDTLHMWEWDVRVLDIQEGFEGNYAPVCVGGRGAAPPQCCGGPTDYRLMLKRQREGAAMSDPVWLTRHSDLFRWCLENGLRVVEPMTLMTSGLYNEPAGAYLPSVLF
jgi:Plasmid pRiA4b ORF-3-like protein